MKKYKYYNNTKGEVISVSRDSAWVSVVVKVTNGALSTTTSEIYPITFIAMDDSLFTGFSESCLYDGMNFTFKFPAADVSAATQQTYMFPTAQWELRLTATELNEAFNELNQITQSLVSTPVITGPTKPIINLDQVYSFSAEPSFAGASISKFFLTIAGLSINETIDAVSNAGTYTLHIPSTVAQDTPFEISVVALDTNGFRSVAGVLKVTAYMPYIDKPTITAPTAGQEVIGSSFTLSSNAFTCVGGTDTLQSVSYQIWAIASGTIVYTKNGTDLSYTITDAPLTRGAAYKVRVKYTGVTYGDSEWSDFVEFSAANGFVTAPSILTPTQNNSIYRYNLVITGSAFATQVITDTHVATQYQILKVSDGSVAYDSGEDTTNLTSITITNTGLTVGENYKIQIRYKGTTLGWSAWSNIVIVSVVASYVAAPTVLTPVAETKITGTSCIITASNFSVVGGTDTQVAAEYRLYNAATNTDLANSGELTDSASFNGYTLSFQRQSTAVNVVVQARYKGTLFGWSAWSTGNTVTLTDDRTGERVDGKATIIGKLGYNWIAVLDAQYRKTLSLSSTGTPFPSGLAVTTHQTNQLLSTWTAAQILSEFACDLKSSAVNTLCFNKAAFSAATWCFSTELLGRSCALPNLQTLAFTYTKRELIDSLDPTLSTYPQYAISGGGWWASSVFQPGYAGNGQYIDFSSGAYLESSGATARYTVPVPKFPHTKIVLVSVSMEKRQLSGDLVRTGSLCWIRRIVRMQRNSARLIFLLRREYPMR